MLSCTELADKLGPTHMIPFVKGIMSQFCLLQKARELEGVGLIFR